MFGQTILEAFSTLPPGVQPEGVAIAPNEAMFRDELVLRVPDHAED